MGGIGSGRYWRFDSKAMVEDYRQIDIRRLQRERLLRPGLSFGWQWTQNNEKVASIQMRTEFGRVILNYSHRQREGEWKKEEYPVGISWAPCNYGGERAWFICPAFGCGRRVAILYGGGVFACRRCYRLAYSCQREDPWNRATRRADKIRTRLGWEPGIFNGSGRKPKWMRWRTFERLFMQHDEWVDISMMEMRQYLFTTNKRLAEIRRKRKVT